MNRKKILVHPGMLPATGLVWAAFEELVPVQFQFSNTLDHCRDADAVILLTADEVALQTILTAGRRCLVISAGGVPLAVPANRTIAFAQTDSLDYRLRGRTVSHNAVGNGRLMDVQAGDEILATYGDIPVWLKRVNKGVTSDFVAFPPPELAAKEHPLDFFNGDHFIQLLPVLHFLREIVGEPEWQDPPLRACFMFDDPNLHWQSYGYIPYPELVRLAKISNFHVAFATVPLDGWFVHGPTARLFRENAKWLSLLIHGNNHLFGELGVERSHERDLQLFAQSLRRIERLEKKSGLHISRVMAPPHGACKPQSFDAMLALGFEAACISPWSLRAWGGAHIWPASFGLQPSEIVSGRFAVPPRFRMSASSLGSIMISAFLNRPMIPVGHHDTVAGGLDLLPRLADFINSFGKVEWGNVESITRSDYRSRRDGELLRLKPHSLKFNITVPEGVTSLCVLPLSSQVNDSFTVVRKKGGHLASQSTPAETPITVEPGENLQFTYSAVGTMDFRAVPAPFTSPWAFTRRLICETRDRFQPVWQRLKSPTLPVPLAKRQKAA